MIDITLAMDESGLLKSCAVRGHAGAGPFGADIVCAAVSALTRTALTVLSGREDIAVRGGPGGRGEFTLETEALSPEGRAFLEAAGTFLAAGLRSVAGEFPRNCRITET